MPTRTRARLLAWSICNNLLARQHHSTEMQEESRRHVVVEDNACDDAQEAHEAHESERALHIPNNESPTLSTGNQNEPAASPELEVIRHSCWHTYPYMQL